jgi:hypothetical protein
MALGAPTRTVEVSIGVTEMVVVVCFTPLESVNARLNVPDTAPWVLSIESIWRSFCLVNVDGFVVLAAEFVSILSSP